MNSHRTVAYVMNGFPRLSETFIAHEIHQLERLGLDLRLYAVKDEREAMVHPVVAAIRAPLSYLPEVTSLSGTTLARWLSDNLGVFWRAHADVAAHHPLRWGGALASALALAWRHRTREEQGHTRPCEVHAIYHGLDTDWFAPTAREVVKTPLILSVGRFVEKKGFDQLIEACALLRDAHVAFDCVIVGERGSAYQAIVRLIDERHLGNRVHLMSVVTQDSLRAFYARAHVFALPCQVMAGGDRDGFPKVLAEAMAMGVPVVSTRISGIPELIDDGVHGLLVEPRDPAGLAEALKCLLLDDALHAHLARNGHQRICERFDSRRTTLALRDLFVAQLQRAQRSAACSTAHLTRRPDHDTMARP